MSLQEKLKEKKDHEEAKIRRIKWLTHSFESYDPENFWDGLDDDFIEHYEHGTEEK